MDAIAKYCNENAGPSRIDYTAQSYVSLKKGRRCWLPMWPRANGTAYVYLRDARGQAKFVASLFGVAAWRKALDEHLRSKIIFATQPLRAPESLRALPVVIISGHAAAAAGCSELLTKPLEMKQLDDTNWLIQQRPRVSPLCVTLRSISGA